MTKVKLVIDRDTATQEIESWLNKKKVYDSTREAHKDSIDLLIEAMMAGDLTLDSTTNEFTHRLLFPEGAGITEMKYRARLNDVMLRPYLNGVKGGDADGRLLAYTAALTQQPKNILSALDTADKKIMMSIAIFFL